MNLVTRRCLTMVASENRVDQGVVQADCAAGRADQKWLLEPPPVPQPAPSVGAECSTTPSTNALRLRASVRGSRRATTTRFGRETRVRGRLQQPDGTPIAGAAICVAGQEARLNDSPETLGTATTDDSGRFSFSVGAGPSRRIWRTPGERCRGQHERGRQRPRAHRTAAFEAAPAKRRRGDAPGTRRRPNPARPARRVPGPARQWLADVQDDAPGTKWPIPVRVPLPADRRRADVSLARSHRSAAREPVRDERLAPRRSPGLRLTRPWHQLGAARQRTTGRLS